MNVKSCTLFVRQKKAQRLPNVWFVDPLQIDSPAAPGAVAVFTTERKAAAYHRKARLAPEWEMFTLPRPHLADLLVGHEYVVFDPSPDGKQGRTATRFQALVELS